MTDVRSCIFCGNRPLTRTHIISQKLQSMLPALEDQSGRTAWWTDHAAGVTRDDSRVTDLSPLNHQVKRACKKCNNVWMNGFEEATRDLVLSLARGEQQVVSSEALSPLVTWVAVVAMLRATEDRGRAAIPPEDYEYIRRWNQPPKNYRIFFVRGERHDGFPTRHVRSFVEGQRAHLTFFWIGEFIAVVMNEPASQFFERRLSVIRSAVAEVATEGVMTWPPRGSVSFPTLIELTNTTS
jgi:hypothetical protein